MTLRIEWYLPPVDPGERQAVPLVRATGARALLLWREPWEECGGDVWTLRVCDKSALLRAAQAHRDPEDDHVLFPIPLKALSISRILVIHGRVHVFVHDQSGQLRLLPPKLSSEIGRAFRVRDDGRALIDLAWRPVNVTRLLVCCRVHLRWQQIRGRATQLLRALWPGRQLSAAS